MSTNDLRKRGGLPVCIKCHEHQTRRQDGICYRCDQQIGVDDLIRRFQVKYPIPMPEKMKGVPPACEGLSSRFETDEALPVARDMCKSCPLYDWCLDYGTWNDMWGTWGGLSQAERRIVRKGLQKRGFELIA